MSNPGVVTLETLHLSPEIPVKIEDNLGESVHIHIGPLRLDLTLTELDLLSEDAKELLNLYLSQFNLSVSNFDPEFLGQIGHMLIDLEHAVFEDVAVSDLLVTIKRGRIGRRRTVPISGSDVIRFMNSDYSGYSDTFGLDNNTATKRVENALNLASSGQYGLTGEHIVVFNDQMFIRDGQHRAAAIYKANPGAIVKVLRLNFRGRRHSISRFPLFASLIALRLRHLRRFVGVVIRAFTHTYRRGHSKVNRLRNAIVNRQDT